MDNENDGVTQSPVQKTLWEILGSGYTAKLLQYKHIIRAKKVVPFTS